MLRCNNGPTDCLHPTSAKLLMLVAIALAKHVMNCTMFEIKGRSFVELDSSCSIRCWRPQRTHSEQRSAASEGWPWPIRHEWIWSWRRYSRYSHQSWDLKEAIKNLSKIKKNKEKGRHHPKTWEEQDTKTPSKSPNNPQSQTNELHGTESAKWRQWMPSRWLSRPVQPQIQV